MDKVFCKKYKKELEAMIQPPIPGPKGEEIQQNFSQKAWNEWISLQTMLINEKHLDLSLKESRKWLNEQMSLFLNNEDYEKPSGFIPQQ
jgi:Fe-S cluster biosynthesis and repair protein YggX|tara:strand:+ start:398 stop:664 length:267 start_codon:yes stop_codon:yes gene_type:complete